MSDRDRCQLCSHASEAHSMWQCYAEDRRTRDGLCNCPRFSSKYDECEHGKTERHPTSVTSNNAGDPIVAWCDGKPSCLREAVDD